MTFISQPETWGRTHYGPVPNGTLNPRGIPLSPHFRDIMPLWLSGRSLLRACASARQKCGSRTHNGHKAGARWEHWEHVETQDTGIQVWQLHSSQAFYYKPIHWAPKMRDISLDLKYKTCLSNLINVTKEFEVLSEIRLFPFSFSKIWDTRWVQIGCQASGYLIQCWRK